MIDPSGFRYKNVILGRRETAVEDFRKCLFNGRTCSQLDNIQNKEVYRTINCGSKIQILNILSS
jgi:hypothetical protein